jgi:hypothetical protein
MEKTVMLFYRIRAWYPGENAANIIVIDLYCCGNLLPPPSESDMALPPLSQVQFRL